MANQNKMRISKRIVDVKRHTKGYEIAGKRYSVAQTRKLAERGRLSGVRVVGRHVQAENGRKRLSSLPMKIV